MCFEHSLSITSRYSSWLVVTMGPSGAPQGAMPVVSLKRRYDVSYHSSAKKYIVSHIIVMDLLLWRGEARSTETWHVWCPPLKWMPSFFQAFSGKMMEMRRFESSLVWCEVMQCLSSSSYRAPVSCSNSIANRFHSIAVFLAPVVVQRA